MAKESSIALGNAKVMNQDGTGEGWLDILGGTVDLGSDPWRQGENMKRVGENMTAESTEGFAVCKGTAKLACAVKFYGNVKEGAAPVPAPTPDIVNPTEANAAVKAGWEQMNDTLANGATEKAVRAEVDAVMEDTCLNFDDKNRTVAGFLLAIISSSLTAKEKDALANAVVDRYAPFAEVQQERKQEVDRTQHAAASEACFAPASKNSILAEVPSADTNATGTEA